MYKRVCMWLFGRVVMALKIRKLDTTVSQFLHSVILYFLVAWLASDWKIAGLVIKHHFIHWCKFYVSTFHWMLLPILACLTSRFIILKHSSERSTRNKMWIPPTPAGYGQLWLIKLSCIFKYLWHIDCHATLKIQYHLYTYTC